MTWWEQVVEEVSYITAARKQMRVRKGSRVPSSPSQACSSMTKLLEGSTTSQ
jgi:hypothetical protein